MDVDHDSQFNRVMEMFGVCSCAQMAETSPLHVHVYLMGLCFRQFSL